MNRFAVTVVLLVVSMSSEAKSYFCNDDEMLGLERVDKVYAETELVAGNFVIDFNDDYSGFVASGLQAICEPFQTDTMLKCELETEGSLSVFFIDKVTLDYKVSQWYFPSSGFGHLVAIAAGTCE